MRPSRPHIAVIGDTHGHLQLALCVAARWQQELKVRFEAVLLCGDVGTFTRDDQLDNATRRHARENHCELEFLTQWAVNPQPPWLDAIFRSEERDGLGLCCPVIMVHGNHEGFEHLAALVPQGSNKQPVPPAALPSVDTAGHIKLLPSGWRAILPSGCTVAGVGGIDRGQRQARYHPLAYLDDGAVLHLAEHAKHVDLLVTHQGPACLQAEGGSAALDMLLEAGMARAWFHGHSIRHPEVVQAGPARKTTVVPLGDIAFAGIGKNDPGPDGWAVLDTLGAAAAVRKEAPRFLREFRRGKWTVTRDGLWVCPPLAPYA